MSNSSNDRRERAAAAKSAANVGGKRRERMIRLAGGATVLVIVIGIIAISVIAKNSDSSTPDPAVTATADPNAALPETVFASDSKYAFGVPVGTATAAMPVLELWEDFQCPACEAVEKANGEGISALASGGKVQLVRRPTTFLDNNLNNDSSLRATAAWGCAIDAGKTEEFHKTVYANPPATEGDGFTNTQLIGFAADSGIEGPALDTFTTCLNDGKYLGWAANSTAAFYQSGAQGTPYALLNGTVVPNDVLADKDKLDALVASTTKS
ncbi:MAG: thioredoxin domain-containing protein [Actinomycetota bacterium]|nr:thioredoxin domain-containing protein [Actinomycetota bacterium]MDP2288963.1 thioredoxin domain-containing protein [Actinomycetota bacterium]